MFKKNDDVALTAPMKAIEQHTVFSRVCLFFFNISKKEHCLLLNLELLRLKFLSKNETEPSGHWPLLGNPFVT